MIFEYLKFPSVENTMKELSGKLDKSFNFDQELKTIK